MKKIIIGAAVAAILATAALADQKTFNQITDSDLQYMNDSSTCAPSQENMKASMSEYFVKNKIIEQAHTPIGSIYMIDSLTDTGSVNSYMFFSNLNVCKEYLKRQ